MTWTAQGTFVRGSDSTTLNVSPAAVGDLVILEVISLSATIWCTAVSGGNCTWAALGTKFTGTNTADTAVVFAGTATATGSAAVSFTWNGTAPFYRAVGQEFTSSAGAWTLDVQGSMDSSSGTNTYPSLTPAAAGELYFGFATWTSTGTAGSTSGYVYQLDVLNYGNCYNLSCTAAAQAPVWGSSGARLGLAVLVGEVAVAADGVFAALAGPLLHPGREAPTMISGD